MQPLRLLPSNPHYLEFRGKPTLLISSAEHYGAVLNLDFDYVRYLDAMKESGCNQTRAFTGTYVEAPGNFGISDNTLAPQRDRFICPWARAEGRGQHKFDLTRWDAEYFARLKDFVAQASKRDVVIEVVLFCYWYGEDFWHHSPMFHANNVNGIGNVPRDKVYSLEDEQLQQVQEAFVRKIVTELNGFDNVYYEICNEPYSNHDGSAFLPWQRRIADVIVETEAKLPHGHLIAQNVHNQVLRVTDLHPAISIVNFHYARLGAVDGSYHLNRVIADDETGFRGQSTLPYRREAWEFMLSGGGIFSHLDFSFTTSHPDGSAEISGETPGFGGAAWRRELAVLRRFMESLPFDQMGPHNEVAHDYRPYYSTRVLARHGTAYAVYVFGGYGISLGLGMAPGNYSVDWIHPAHGNVLRSERIEHRGGVWRSETPTYAEDLAIRILAR